jgi:uncharacterized UBP type Zn finger protein
MTKEQGTKWRYREEPVKRLILYKEHIYYNNLEKEDLEAKIRFLKDQIQQLHIEVSQYTKKEQQQNQARYPSLDENIQLDETGEIKAGSVDKLVESLYRDWSEKPGLLIQFLD